MALTCELCGGTDLVKQGDFFVCQACGAKYTLEDARKMMGVTGAPAAPAAAPAAGAQIENLLNLARSAQDAGNNKEAESYANRVIEQNTENAEAWLIKGQAAGWQSTLANNRINESVECWKNCLKYAPPEKKEEYKTTIIKEWSNLQQAVIITRANNFASLATESNKKALVNSKLEIVLSLANMIAGGFADGESKPSKINEAGDQLLQTLAEKANSAAVTASDEADKDYGPERSDKNKFAYRTWIEKTDYCLEVLEEVISIANKEVTVETIKKNYDAIQNSVINSCSYKFEVSGGWSGYVEDTCLTDTAKTFRRNGITAMGKKRDEQLKTIKEQKAEAYWGKHPEEKTALTEEQTALTKEQTALKDEQKKIAAAKKEQLSDPQDKEKARLKEPVEAAAASQKASDEILKLSKEQGALGMFKGKEKKEDLKRAKLEGQMLRLEIRSKGSGLFVHKDPVFHHGFYHRHYFDVR